MLSKVYSSAVWLEWNFVEGERQSFTLYASNLVEIHRTKLSNADQLFEKHLGTLLKPPFEDNISIFNNQV